MGSVADALAAQKAAKRRANRQMRVPTPLDRFLPIDFETLQYVVDHGSITIEFETDNMATNTKARLWRLKESLQVNAIGDPLTKASKYFVFKIRRNILTISDRVRSKEVASQRQAIVQQPPLTADPQEFTFSFGEDSNEQDKGSEG